MRIGVVISSFAHVGLLSWGLFAFPAADAFHVEPVQAMPVDLVPIEELTKLQKGTRAGEKRDEPVQAARPEPAKEPPKPADPPPAAEPVPEPPKMEVAALPKEPEPEPAPAAPPPQAEPAPAAEPEKPKEAEAKETPPPLPRAKPRPPKPAKTVTAKKDTPDKPADKSFSSDKIAALLDKQKKPAASTADTGPKQTASLGSPNGTSVDRMTQSELDALRAQIQQCWNPPLGAVEAENLKVRLQFQLKRDGQVASRPAITNSGSSPFFRAAADSARRAILRCQPYNLPIEKYDAWRDVVVTFDPKDMIGG